MKTPVGLRPAAWGPRQRIIGAVVVVLVLAGVALWWVGGAENRRLGAACNHYYKQQGPLRAVSVEVKEAAERSADAGDTQIIPFFNDINGPLNSLRRWQSTAPRLADTLGDVGDDGVVRDGERTFDSVTEGVAEMQRLIEDDVATAADAYVSELDARLQNADDLCAGR